MQKEEIIEETVDELTSLKQEIETLKQKILNNQELAEKEKDSIRLQLSQLARQEINKHRSEKEVFEHKIINKICVQIFQQIDILKKYLQHHSDSPIAEGVHVFIESIMYILNEAMIEEISPEQSQTFEPHRHKSIDTHATEDKSLHGKIHTTKTAGLLYKKEKTILPAEVITYKFTDK